MEYAREHDGIGPLEWTDLKSDEQDARRFRSPYRQGSGPDDQPYLFLIPGVPIADRGREAVPHERRQPVVLELEPYLDDGEHWVLLNDGTVERRAIDRELTTLYGLTVRPVKVGEPGALRVEHTYSVYAQLPGEPTGTARLTLTNMTDGSEADVTWDLGSSAPGGPEDLKAWRVARAKSWQAMGKYSDSPILQTWTRACNPEGVPSQARRRGRGETTSAFGLLGGRAAVRETLQMQAIGAEGTGAEEPTIDVETVQGVGVASHPYEEMLAGGEGGRLALADSVPPDRFVVYLPRPERVFRVLDGGGQFVARAGAGVTGNSVRYDLKDRYLARLGFTEDWVRLLLTSGAVSEMAVFCPDLFFIDGTDVTVVCRLRAGGLVQPLLGQIGLGAVTDGAVVAGRSLDGAPTWWALHGDILLVSTNRGELDSSLELMRNGGRGGLGQTAELRYMLTKLAPDDGTVAFAYFSDPFIRRLVGPEVKVGQLRRIRARARLGSLSAAALLWRAEGRPGVPTVDDLVAAGYLQSDPSDQEAVLGADMVATSDTWGTAAHMVTLLEQPVKLVTEGERKAYEGYVTNYNRFWRRYFDPIAVRLSGDAEAGYELETFILPLVDSTLYNAVRGFAAAREGASTLDIPSISPAPVMMLSLNLSEQGWRGLTEGFGREALDQLGIDGVVLDYLGPAVHLAVQDADPVVCLGSGDILGAFGGGGVDDEVFAIPLVLSILTRPCRILVQVADEEKVREVLRGMALGARQEGSEWIQKEFDFYRVGQEDRWVGSAGFAGMIKLRFGVEVCGGYLVISNIPWLDRTTIDDVVPAAMNGAMLEVFPGAVREQMPGFYTAAMENERKAAMQSLGHVAPFAEAGFTTPAEAVPVHARLFGFAPVHPEGGDWVFEGGRAASTEFGDWWQQRQPAYSPDAGVFGLLGGLQSASANMQFEEDGLRVLCRWTFPGK